MGENPNDNVTAVAAQEQSKSRNINFKKSFSANDVLNGVLPLPNFLAHNKCVLEGKSHAPTIVLKLMFGSFQMKLSTSVLQMRHGNFSTFSLINKSTSGEKCSTRRSKGNSWTNWKDNGKNFLFKKKKFLIMQQSLWI